MVMQLSSTALVYMGRAPNPITGKTEIDLDTARAVADQLEMLETKTKGNLSREEDQLLKQSLMTVRMSFVQAFEAAKKAPGAVPESKPAPAAPSGATETPPTAEAAEDSKKKFTKSYGAP
jgi:hypothetical protein